jgi:hypothetical protein
MTSTDVVAEPAGPERDQRIDAWCASVWEAFREDHRTIADLVRAHGIA